MPKFQDKLNKTLCLVKTLVGGYVVGKKNGEDILIPNNNGEMEISCNINDTDKYKYFTESMVYHTPKEYEVGDKLLIPDVGEYYVVDVGYQEDDGKIQYLIAR